MLFSAITAVERVRLALLVRATRRSRSGRDLALALLPWWAHIASRSPRLFNAASARWISRSSRVQRLSEPSFASWFATRKASCADRKQRVILWPGTTINYFDAGSARQATELLEAAGCHVTLAEGVLCCGRPVFDAGFPLLGATLLREVVETLDREIEEQTPVVVLDPSCFASFKTGLVRYCADDPRARALSELVVPFADFPRAPSR